MKYCATGMQKISLFFICCWLMSVEANVVEPLTSFSFERSQCKQNIFTDSSNNPVVGIVQGNGMTAACIESDGASSMAKLQSSGNVTLLKRQLESTDFSIELWLRPQLSLKSPLTIAAFGRNVAGHGTCTNNFMITQQVMSNSQNDNEIAYLVRACRIDDFTTAGGALQAPTITAQATNGRPQLLHLFIDVTFATINSGGMTFQTISVNYTVNGARLDDGIRKTFFSTVSFDASTWDSGGFLNIFPAAPTPTTTVGATTSGDIHHFAVYNQILPLSAIREKYAQRLPNSLPVVHSSTVTIQENGEVGDHSTQPEFYSSPIPSTELAMVALTVHDLEDYAYGPPSAAQRPLVYLSSFPVEAEGCKIYQLDGTEILFQSNGRTYIVYDTATDSFAVRVRPPLDQHSVAPTTPLCRFSFSALDGVTGLPSAEVATVDVIVTHVNKPPSAVSLSLTTYAAVHTTVTLNGTDPDSALSHAVVVALPDNGNMFVAGLRALAVGDIIPGPPFQLQYIYTGSQSALSASAVVGTDSFLYAMVDTEGRHSVPAVVTITAASALFGSPAPALADAPQTKEDTLSSVKLFGGDRSSSPRVLSVQIIATPTFGTLFDPSGGEEDHALSAGNKLAAFLPARNYSTGLSVAYLSRPHYFTIPTQAWDGTPLSHPPDSFEYRVITEDGAMSLPVTQYVHIRNVNDPTYINFTFPAEWAETRTILVRPDKTSGLGKVIIEGFNITDIDLGVDVVHATVVLTGEGTMTLNKKFLSRVDFNSARYCGIWTTWTCYGDGTTTAMSFVGTPGAIAAVLNGMTYASTATATEAAITVALHDGEGGNCLTNAQHGGGSIRSGCYSTELTIKISIQSSSGDSTGAGGSSQSLLMARLMYVGIALVVCCFLVALRCYCAKRSLTSEDKDKPDDKHPLDKYPPPSNNPGIFTSAARSLYASLPTMSPGRPRRKKRGLHGDDPDVDDSTAEDGYEFGYGYDEEECRTPPRRPKSLSLSAPAAHTPGHTPPSRSTVRTPPCTPGTPESPAVVGRKSLGPPSTPRVRVVHSGGDTRSATTGGTTGGAGAGAGGDATPRSRTVVISRDVTTPDGKKVTETTHITLPYNEKGVSLRDGGGVASSVGGNTARVSASSNRHSQALPKRAFPELTELADLAARRGGSYAEHGAEPVVAHPPARSRTTSPRKSTPHSGSKERRSKGMSEDFADQQSISTISCSVGNSTVLSKAPPQCSSKIALYEQVPKNGLSLFESEDLRGAEKNGGKTIQVSSSTKKLGKPKGKSKNKDKCRPAESVWTQHMHRSGKIFFYNAETGQSTWRKPLEVEIC